MCRDSREKTLLFQMALKALVYSWLTAFRGNSWGFCMCSGLLVYIATCAKYEIATMSIASYTEICNSCITQFCN